MKKIYEPEHLELSTLEKVKDRLERMGWTEPKRPGFPIPEVPKDLISRGGDFITELYRELLAWSEYVTSLHTIAELSAKEWKNNLTVLTKKLVREGLEAEKIDVDEAILAARKNCQTFEQEAGLWGIQATSLTNRMKLVSRAVTILEQELEKHRRGSNIGAGKRWPFPSREKADG